MQKILVIAFILTILLPNTAKAEFKTPDHRWTIGYEGGICLRRFLDDNWDVYLGGGPDDYKTDRESNRSQSINGIAQPNEYTVTTNDKSESGFIFLGIGRRLIRDDRFWMTGTLSLSYRWENFQYLDERNYLNSDEYINTERIGHNMSTRAMLGIRSAYDITSRIVLMLEFGVFYQHFTETSDYNRFEQRETSWREENTREAYTTDRIGIFSYHSITSIGLVFRF